MLRRRMMMGQGGGETDPAKMYLTTRFVGEGTCSITFETASMGAQVYYSVDNGRNWSYYTTSFTVDSQHPVLWKASGVYAGSSDGIGYFSATGLYEVYGNIMSMQNGDNFATSTTIANTYQFLGLFKNDTHLVSAENLVLPATTLANYCYSQMFYGCTSLTTAPELPAMGASSYCYYRMFRGCTSLTNAPELPATSLGGNCYQEMFYGCTSLMYAPKLPATTLATYCYHSMFRGCTSLIVAPILAAETLPSYCYSYMFYGCSSLYNIVMLAKDQNLTGNQLQNWVSGVKSTGCLLAHVMGLHFSSGASGKPSNWKFYRVYSAICDLINYDIGTKGTTNTGIKLFSEDKVYGNVSYRIDLEATIVEVPSSWKRLVSCGSQSNGLYIDMNGTSLGYGCEPIMWYQTKGNGFQVGDKISLVIYVYEQGEGMGDEYSEYDYNVLLNGSYAGDYSFSFSSGDGILTTESNLYVGDSGLKVRIDYLRIYDAYINTNT